MNKSKQSLEELIKKESFSEEPSKPTSLVIGVNSSTEGENIMNSKKSLSFKRQSNGKYMLDIPKSIDGLSAEKVKELKIIYDRLKYLPKFFDFFNQENREELNETNFEELREYIHNTLHKNSSPKDEIRKKRIRMTFSEGFKKDVDKRLNEIEGFQEIPVEPNEFPVQEGFQEGGFSEEPSESPVQELDSSPKQNMIVLYDNAQKALANVGIDTPLDNLLLPRNLKERFIANPEESLDDVIREASKNYAINVYKQRYKDIEDSSFKSFLEEAVNEGLINPYRYFDKNREERVMYLFGDKAMTEPELREEFNKYRFKNLIKGNKNKLHEFAERAIMKKREKQLEAYKEMKQTTHDAIRPKMVLNPMLFKHD